MVVGVCRLTLMVPDSHSLKAKRMVLRRIKDRTRHKFNVAIAEVGSQDAWQQAVVGFAVVANEHAFVDKLVRNIIDFIESLAVAKLMDDEVDIINYGDSPVSSGDWAHWEPDMGQDRDDEPKGAPGGAPGGAPRDEDDA